MGGINYYLRTKGCEKSCPHCTQRSLHHIGKASAGWKFEFRAHSEWSRDNAYKMWSEEIANGLQAGGHIEDEYGNHVTLAELKQLIKAKQDMKSHAEPDPGERTQTRWGNWRDLWLSDNPRQSQFENEGYDFCDREFS